MTSHKRRNEDGAVASSSRKVARMSIEPAPRKRRREKRSSPPNLIPDDDDDPGRTQSQQLLAISKALSKAPTKQEYVREMQTKIEQDKERLHELLISKPEELMGTCPASQGSLRSQLDDESLFFRFSSSAAFSKATPDADTNTEDRHDTFPGADVVEKCRELIGKYQEVAAPALDQTLPTQIEAMICGWQQDQEKLARILSIGKQVTQERIRRFVENIPDEENGGPSNDSFEYKEASKHFKLREPAGPTVTDMLNRAESGIKRFTKHLPIDTSGV